MYECKTCIRYILWKGMNSILEIIIPLPEVDTAL
jgi:hypothetical protein